MVHKDIKKLLKQLRNAGFEIRYTTDGHPMVYRDGEYITKLATSPSDKRGIKNALAQLKRSGFQS